MAKFCKYCGKELQNNQKCDCTKKEMKKSEELEKAKNTIKEEASSGAKIYFDKVIRLIGSNFQNPFKTAKEYIIEEDHLLTIILLVLSSMIISVCSISFIKGIYSDVNLYQMNHTMKNIWHFSYFKMLCCIFLGVMIGYFILGVIFNIGFEKISKKNITFKKALSIVSISLLEPTIFCIIASFATIFSYKIAALLILYLLLLFLFNLYENFKSISESKHYNQFFTILILLFVFLAVYLIPNLFL